MNYIKIRNPQISYLVWENRLHKGNSLLRVPHYDGCDTDAHGHSETDQIIPELHSETEKEVLLMNRQNMTYQSRFSNDVSRLITFLAAS